MAASPADDTAPAIATTRGARAGKAMRADVDAGAATRKRLVGAATALIMEGGYGAATVAAVAKRAGVANGTLYRHFPSKGALFLEVFRSVCGHEEALMRAAARRAPSAADAIDAIVETFVRRALHHPRLAWALLSEPTEAVVENERLVYRRRDREMIAEVVRRGIEAGEFAPQDPELAAAALVGAIGDALVGPLSPVDAEGPADAGILVSELSAFCRRALGVSSAR